MDGRWEEQSEPLTNPGGDGMTRRAAVARFGALTALLATPAGLARVSAAHAAVTVTPGFTPERQKTFMALIAAYDGQPGSIVSTKGRDILQDATARYEQQTPGGRTVVDATLDALEAAPRGDRFSALTVEQRRGELSRWYTAVDPQDARTAGTPRPSDLQVRTLDESNAAVRAAIRDFTKTLPSDAWELDPVTLLPRYAPRPDPSYRPAELEPPSEVLTLRRLRTTVFRLMSTLFTSDPHAIDQARLS